MDRQQSVYVAATPGIRLFGYVPARYPPAGVHHTDVDVRAETGMAKREYSRIQGIKAKPVFYWTRV